MTDITKARLKLFLAFLLSNILLFYKEALYFNLFFFLIIILFIFYKQKFSIFITWLKPLFITTIIIFLIQLLTKQSLLVSFLSSLRILSLSSLIFLLMYTTKISLIIGALSFLPKHISFVLSLSLGMIPQLSKEAIKITVAQQARGHQINWNIFKSYLPIILPLFTKSFIRAEQISNSMQTRGFVI
jgi:energy-coupling factor transport system permease protein